MKQSKLIEGFLEHAHNVYRDDHCAFINQAVHDGTIAADVGFVGVIAEGQTEDRFHNFLVERGFRQFRESDDDVSYVSPTTTVDVSLRGGNKRIVVRTSDREEIAPIEAELDAWLVDPPADPPTVYSFGVTRDGYTVRDVGTLTGGLQRENYSSEIVAQFDRVVEQLRAPTPAGRLVLMEGEPGTGKTHLVRALIVALMNDCKCILVPPNVMADLAGPAFLDALMEQKGQRMVLILEDADDCLIAREKNAAAKASLSSLLNMSDGILGAALDLCIVATTNQRFDNLDRAVLRPGRLLQRMSVGALSPNEAAACFHTLTGKERDYHAPRTLAQVYEDSGEVA